MRVETRLQQGLQLGLVAQLVAQLTFNQLVVGSSPTEPIMRDTHQKQNDVLLHAIVHYDRLQIVFSELMEFWLEGKEPPAWLVSAYYDELEEVQVAMNYDRLFEHASRKNRDFYDEIQNKLEGLLDKTPDSF